MAMLMSGMMATSTQAEDPAKPTEVVATSTQAAVGRTATISKDPNLGVESSVREYFKDIPLMAEVAKCESHFHQFEKDGSVYRGRITTKDVGVMQVNEYYHLERAKKLGYDLHTIDGNMAYARLLYNEEGTDPWVSSSPCWMKSDVAKAVFSKKVLAEK